MFDIWYLNFFISGYLPVAASSWDGVVVDTEAPIHHKANMNMWYLWCSLNFVNQKCVTYTCLCLYHPHWIGLDLEVSLSQILFDEKGITENIVKETIW